MRYRSLILASALFGIPAAALAGPPEQKPPVNASPAAQTTPFTPLVARHAKLFAPMRPEARLKVQAASRALVFDLAGHQSRERANKMAAAGKPFDLASAARARVAEAGNFGLVTPSGADIDALVQIVMFQATQDADADLRAVLAAMDAINKAKQAQREGVEAMRRALAAEKEKLRQSDYDEISRAVTGKLDSMSEMGETESLRLQMAMDRVSKFMLALSNIMKKSGDTAEAIVQNMK